LRLLAALYHHFIRRDGLFRRTWFGMRWAAASKTVGGANIKAT
jgi:hypothetical protein